jgi:DNA-directed RNA polymerase subunit N (RpoN/RPB10)
MVYRVLDDGKTISEKYEEYQNWLNDNNSISQPKS